MSNSLQYFFKNCHRFFQEGKIKKIKKRISKKIYVEKLLLLTTNTDNLNLSSATVNKIVDDTCVSLQPAAKIEMQNYANNLNEAIAVKDLPHGKEFSCPGEFIPGISNNKGNITLRRTGTITEHRNPVWVYREDDVIGKGGFGKVYNGVIIKSDLQGKLTTSDCAIKTAPHDSNSIAERNAYNQCEEQGMSSTVAYYGSINFYKTEYSKDKIDADILELADKNPIANELILLRNNILETHENIEQIKKDIEQIEKDIEHIEKDIEQIASIENNKKLLNERLASIDYDLNDNTTTQYSILKQIHNCPTETHDDEFDELMKKRASLVKKSDELLQEKLKLLQDKLKLRQESFKLNQTFNNLSHKQKQLEELDSLLSNQNSRKDQLESQLEKSSPASYHKLTRLFKQRTGIYTNQIVMEKCPQTLGPLFSAINSNTEMDNELKCKVIKSLLHQALQAINELHLNRMAHLDIKLGNICYDKYGMVKLLDLAFLIPEQKELLQGACIGTLSLMAPELLPSPANVNRIDPIRCDIYSAGLLITRILQNKDAYKGMSSCFQEELKKEIIEEISTHLTDEDRNKRMSLEDFLESSVFFSKSKILSPEKLSEELYKYKLITEDPRKCPAFQEHYNKELEEHNKLEEHKELEEHNKLEERNKLEEHKELEEHRKPIGCAPMSFRKNKQEKSLEPTLTI